MLRPNIKKHSFIILLVTCNYLKSYVQDSMKLDLLEMKLQELVTCHVDSGNRIQILCKTTKCY